MRLLDQLEVPHGQQMVNMLDRVLPAPFACSARPLDGGSSRGLPADAVAPGWAALPPRVRRSVYELRLPFGHAGAMAKHAVTVEVAGRAGEFLTAPIANARHLMASTGTFLTAQALYAARLRAILLSPLARRDWRITSRAPQSRTWAPAVFVVARARAERLGLLASPPDCRVEHRGTLLAVPRLSTSHTYTGRQWLSAPETALALGSKPRAIYLWLKRGRFPGAIRTPGGRWRVPAADVHAARVELGITDDGSG